jgi:hypothetical protein
MNDDQYEQVFEIEGVGMVVCSIPWVLQLSEERRRSAMRRRRNDRLERTRLRR